MLEIRPTHLKPAREFVGKYHRHNIPPVGGKFAISCFEGERLCGDRQDGEMLFVLHAGDGRAFAKLGSRRRGIL